MCFLSLCFLFFFFKQKTAYEMRISDWSSDVCSSDLTRQQRMRALADLAPLRLRKVLRQMLQPVGQPLLGPRLMLRLPEVGQGSRIAQIGRASCRERVCQYV